MRLQKAWIPVLPGAKAGWELDLARDVKGKKKGVYRYLNSKRKTRENMDLLLKWNRRPPDRRHGKHQGAQCLLHLGLCW